MKKMLIAGNWKMHTNVFEAEKLSEYIFGGMKQMSEVDIEVLLCPPFTALYTVKNVIQNSNIHLGAQNCHYESKGAYTGEISVPMLTDLGCSHVIIGHSERRILFQENNELLNKKVKAVLDYGYNLVFCIGETLEERSAGKTFDVLKTQIIEGLKDIKSENLKQVIVAYEPVWAIGTGVSASIAQVEEAHNWLREFMMRTFGESAANTVLLYGGSMNPANAKDLLTLENVNGGLIGGAALDPEKFMEIIHTAQNIVKD